MRALCWHGKGDVRVDTVPDPAIQHPRDAIIKITACAICGSDLHLLDGYQPTMEAGDILGHENMGEVIELGSEVTNLGIGDRVVVPFTISCGACWFCKKGMFSACDRTNPNAAMAIKAMGQSPAGLFGFSHMMGGYSGGQAEYLRVPMADIGPIKIPDSVTTSRRCSCPTSSLPATWRPRMPKSRVVTRSRSGAAARSASHLTTAFLRLAHHGQGSGRRSVVVCAPTRQLAMSLKYLTDDSGLSPPSGAIPHMASASCLPQAGRTAFCRAT